MMGGGGWDKRKFPQISDLQRLAYLVIQASNLGVLHGTATLYEL